MACALVAFAPWAASGRRERTSFELVRSVEELRIVPAPWSAVTPVWFLLPVACGVALLLSWRLRHLAASLASATVGLVVAAAAAVVARSPLVETAHLSVALVTGLVTLAASATLLGLTAARKGSP